MHERDLDDRSRLLGDRVDALARALGQAGVAPEAASRLLESAATAALHALTLEVLVATAAQAPARAAVEQLPEPAPVDVAEAA